jgi:hypothetical protein
LEALLTYFPPSRCLASKGNQHLWDTGYADSRKTTSYPRCSKGCCWFTPPPPPFISRLPP